MKIVAVTGATGFVGSRLCERLINDEWQVRRALRRAGAAEGVVVGELGPETDWSGAVAGVDAVVHLAARVHVMQEQAADPLAEFRRVNVQGTLNLARQAAEAGVRRFVYLSSIKVNGEHTGVAGSVEQRVLSAEKDRKKDAGIGSPLPNPPLQGEGNQVRVFREDGVPDPQDAYAISKWEAEQGLMKLVSESGMEVVIIRPPLVYGPGVKANFLNMMRWLYKGIPLPFGAIKNRRSLVALDNLIDLIVTCLEHPAAANQIFLVSDDEDLSTTDLLRRTTHALGKTPRLLPVPQWLLTSGLKILGKNSHAQRLCGSLQVDISKTKELLGWKPPLSVDEALNKTAEDFLRKR